MREKNISVFGSDISSNSGYIYSNTSKLSANLANQRMSDAIVEMIGTIKGRRVIDIGCGDGCYTSELMQLAPSYLLGVDANEAAIKHAKQKNVGVDGLDFEVMDVYQLSAREPFDVAIVRGLLHHLYDVEAAIEAICKVANEIIVVEPNGYNPVLKVIEKVSPYHVAHEEKSYFPKKLDSWFIAKGGSIVKTQYIGLVPMFMPDFLARICKFFEPLIEKIPLLRQLACAQYVQKVSVKKT